MRPVPEHTTFSGHINPFRVAKSAVSSEEVSRSKAMPSFSKVLRNKMTPRVVRPKFQTVRFAESYVCLSLMTESVKRNVNSSKIIV